MSCGYHSVMRMRICTENIELLLATEIGRYGDISVAHECYAKKVWYWLLNYAYEFPNAVCKHRSDWYRSIE